MIIWLVKRLLIKLGWLKAPAADTGCGWLPEVKTNYYQDGQRNERPAGGSPFDIGFC